MENKRIIKIGERIFQTFGKDKINLSSELITKIEAELEISFPLDFKQLCEIYRYDCIGSFNYYNFEGLGDYSVVVQTKSWRESINLPLNYLVLSDDGTSALLMKIENDNANVIHCALEDVLNLCAGRPMEYDPIIFETFADFFEFLLDEEEE